jgi:hypothetical protein
MPLSLMAEYSACDAEDTGRVRGGQLKLRTTWLWISVAERFSSLACVPETANTG